MVSVVYLLTQKLIRELEPVDQRIDDVADVERHSHRVDGIPNPDEMNPGFLGMAVSDFEVLGRSRAGFAAHQSHQNGSVATAVIFVCFIHALVESCCGRLLLRIDNTAFYDETR